MKFLLPVMMIFTVMNASAAVTNTNDGTPASLAQSVQNSTDRLRSFIEAHGPAFAEQIQKMTDTAINQTQKYSEITVATSVPNPLAHPMTLICGAFGGSAGKMIGATGEIGLCFDIAGGKDIAAHPGKYAYLLHVVGLGKVHGVSMTNKLILVSGSINENSTIAGHYLGTAIGAHGILGLGAGAFLKMDGVDPRSLDPMADKVFIHDVTVGAGASISLTADALDIKKL